MVRNNKKYESFDYETIRRRPLKEGEESAEFGTKPISSPEDGAEPTIFRSATTTSTKTTAAPATPATTFRKPSKPTTSKIPVSPPNWMLRNGHLMSFVGVFLFTIAVYVRPYELISALKPFSTMAFWIAVGTIAVFVPTQLGLEGNLTSRPKEVNLLLLFLLCALLSIPFADDRLNSFNSLIDFMKVAVIFIVMVNVLRNGLRWKLLVLLLLLISCFLGFSALKNYRSGTQLVEDMRVVGSIGNMFENPNDLALHLVTMVPIAIGLFLASRNPMGKLFYALCTFLMLAGIMVTFSRGGALGLVCALVVLGRKLMHNNRIIAYAAIGVLAGALLVFAPGGIKSRFKTIFDQDQASSVGARKDDLKRSILVTLRHPLFGVGIGNFLLRSNRGLATHNAYTQVSAEMGIPALVLYVMFMVIPIKRLRRIEKEVAPVKKKSRFFYLCVAMQASLIGYMVCSMFASVAFLWYLYYLVALSVCLGRLYELEQIKVKEPSPFGARVATAPRPNLAIT